MIISTAAIKGGVGKSTISVALAETISRERPDQPVLLLDLDPQGSASGWFERTPGLTARIKTLVGQTVGQLPRLIRSAAKEEEIVILDTPPGHPEITDAAMGESDFVVVPTSPYLDPLTQAVETIKMAQAAEVPAAVVLNMVKSGANDAAAASQVLANADIKLIEPHLPSWVAISRIDGSGWPKSGQVTHVFEALAASVLQEAMEAKS